MAVLENSRKVGMAGTRQMNLLDLLVDRPGAHAIAPVCVVPVFDQERHWAAERASVADPAPDGRAVGLDLHAPAAAVTELAAREVAVDPLAIDREAGRQALDHGYEAGAVGFARSREAQGGHRTTKATWRGSC